jgi:Uma2 family endonuclease
MQPEEQILRTPPLLVIEIISSEDLLCRYLEKLSDYRKMGVTSIWVIDPGDGDAVAPIAWDCSTASWLQATRLEVPGTAICLDVDELRERD